MIPKTIFFLCMLSTVVCAQEYIDSTYHFRIHTPWEKGWKRPQIKTAETGELQKPLQLLFIAEHLSGKKISIQVMGIDDDKAIGDPEYRRGFLSGLVRELPKTVHVTTEKLSSFAGVPSYEFSLLGTIHGRPIHMRMVAAAALHHQYVITAYSADTLKMTDADLDTVLAGFRFTKPIHAVELENQDSQTGDSVGMTAFFLCAVLLVCLIVFLVLKKRKTT